MFYQKRQCGVPVFVFEELERIAGFVHAFTSRQTDSVMKDAQNKGAVASEKTHLLDALMIEPRSVVFLRQVHSDEVVSIQDGDSGGFDPVCLGPADAVLALSPERFPVIRTADCVPILAISPDRRQLCAIHAGWRGTRDRIAAKAVNGLLEATGASPDEIVVALGPCIRKCCYEVGPEVRRQYEAAGHSVASVFEGRFLDLVEANKDELRNLGINQILDSEMCTSCRADLFYSYRREGETGRLWMLAGFR